MAFLKVQRKTLAGSSTEFEFPVKGTKFLVKNLSDAECYVNFEAITNENEDTSILIPAQIAQVVLANEITHFGVSSIYVKGTGDVEVQVINW